MKEKGNRKAVRRVRTAIRMESDLPMRMRKEVGPSNDRKLSDSGPGARVGARRREAKAAGGAGLHGGAARPVTEPVGQQRAPGN